MNVKVICSILLFSFALSFFPSQAQVAVVTPSAAYNYGYPGLWSYYGYHGYGNPYYMYSSRGYDTGVTGGSHYGGGHPAISSSGGISATIACANCGFGRN